VDDPAPIHIAAFLNTLRRADFRNADQLNGVVDALAHDNMFPAIRPLFAKSNSRDMFWGGPSSWLYNIGQIFQPATIQEHSVAVTKTFFEVKHWSAWRMNNVETNWKDLEFRFLADLQADPLLLQKFMKMVRILHDIGKPVVVHLLGGDEQDTYTPLVANYVLQKLGFDHRSTCLMEGIVRNGVASKVSRGTMTPLNAIKSSAAYATACDVPLSDWFDLRSLWWATDGSFYQALADVFSEETVPLRDEEPKDDIDAKDLDDLLMNVDKRPSIGIWPKNNNARKNLQSARFMAYTCTRLRDVGNDDGVVANKRAIDGCLDEKFGG